MIRRVGVILAFAFALSAVAWAAPPPPCTCDFCVPDPEAKCKLSQGGKTTCGIFMRSGICLGLSASDLPHPGVATQPPAGSEACAKPSSSLSSAAHPFAASPFFPSVLDDVRPSSCSCRDECFSDLQCILFHGPGSECVPVGPCQCKECTATS